MIITIYICCNNRFDNQKFLQKLSETVSGKHIYFYHLTVDLQHRRMSSILFKPAELLYSSTQDGCPIEEYVRNLSDSLT